MNHYPRHVGDYLRKTIGLSMIQDGAYTRMIDLYYNEEAPLPLHKAEIYASVRCQSKADRDAVDYVLKRYFTETPDGYRNDRCDEELAKFSEKSAKASQSASARWSKPHSGRNANASPDAMRTHSVGNASQEPVTSNQEPVSQKQGQEQSGAIAPSAPKRPRAVQLPKGWAAPPEWLAWARKERPEWSESDALRVSLLFRDHWHGKGEARADWGATWRNWVRRELNFKATGNAKQTARAAVMGEIFKDKEPDGNHDERTIDGQSERVA